MAAGPALPGGDEARRNEARLVEEAQRGEGPALEQLLSTHYDRVHALCRRMVGEADADDATQDALLAAVRGIKRFDGRSALSTWLYRVATNTCLDELRRRRRRPVVGYEDDIGEDEHGLGIESGTGGGDGSRYGRDPADSVADRLDVDAALATLPEEFRVAVVLRDLMRPLVRGDRPGHRRACRHGALADRTRTGGVGRRDRERGHAPRERGRLGRRPIIQGGTREGVAARDSAAHDRKRRRAPFMTGEHLSDEFLSAHLDGVTVSGATYGATDGDVATHLAECPQCSTRLASLAAARDLVRTPPEPVTAEARAAAVAMVLQRARLEAAAGGTVHDIAGPPAVVKELAWYRRPGALVGAAAAVVVMAFAIPLALDAGSSTSKSPSSPLADSNGLRKSAQNAFASPAHGSGSAEPNAAAPSVPFPSSAPAVPDLGSVSSPAQLQSDVAALASPGSASAKSPAASGSSSIGVDGSCVQNTRNASHGGAYGPPVIATAVYQGTAALVMEFWTTPNAPAADAPPSSQGVIAVVSQSSCTLLATTPT